MRLLILSNVIHYRYRGQIYAYGPYAREIEVWAELFPGVTIAAPCREEPPSSLAVPFVRGNIAIDPQLELGGDTLAAKLWFLLALPVLLLHLCRAMWRADAIHVRAPGSFGLLGALLAPLFSRRLMAKFAGQWNGYPGEPWTVRLQRALLGSSWWKGPVTVYGRWPNQRPHVVPFFTSVLTREQVARAEECAAARTFTGPLRVLFVGRLSAAKNVDILLEAIARLRDEGLRMECVIVGDGKQRSRLEKLARDLGLADRAAFAGGVAFEKVLDQYERADILVLASETEGWPKAIAEAMVFGLVAVGSNRGLVPEMLGEGRGCLVPPGDSGELAAVLARLAGDRREMAAMSGRAAAWSRNYSLDGLRDALRDLLASHWNVPIGGLPQSTPVHEP